MDSSIKLSILIVVSLLMIYFLFSGSIIRQYKMQKMKIEHLYQKYIGRLFIGGGY